MSDQSTSTITDRPRVGVSACLAGEEVRYDGDHKRHPEVVGRLAELFELLPICPEVEIGLGIPREPIQLEQTSSGVRLVAVPSGRDHTVKMQEFSRRTVQQVELLQVCGYILKSRSPSCGLQKVKLFDEDGSFQRNGRGIFATELEQHGQSLPLVEESTLQDDSTREHFVEQVQAFHRLRSCLSAPWDPARLLQFHVAHRLQLQSHDAQGHQQLDKLVVRMEAEETAQFQMEYRRQFLKILAQPVTTS